MEYLITILWGGMELIFFHVFRSAFLPTRKAPRQQAVLFLLTWASTILYAVFVPVKLVKMTLTLLIVFASSCFGNRGTWYQHLIYTVLGYMVNGLMDTLAIYGISALLGVSYEDFVWMKLFYVVTVTMSKLISIFLAWILRRLRKTAGGQTIQRRWILLIFLFPAVSIVMLAVIYFEFQGQQDLSMGAVVFSIVLAAANVAIIYLIGVMENNTKQLQENALLHQQMDIQTDSIVALERSYRDQRKATHEYKNQLQTIYDLLENEKVADAKAYVGHLQEMQTTRIFIVNSRHPIIDAVLNHKYQTAKEHEIDFQIQVNDLSQISIGTDELVVLLSNLLDNAIEACCRMEGHRAIKCSILYDGALFLSVRNTSNPVTFVGDTIPTSKTPKEEHGFGLSRIQLILKQLKAEFTFSYENGWFEFVTEIPEYSWSPKS